MSMHQSHKLALTFVRLEKRVGEVKSAPLMKVCFLEFRISNYTFVTQLVI